MTDRRSSSIFFLTVICCFIFGGCIRLGFDPYYAEARRDSSVLSDLRPSEGLSFSDGIAEHFIPDLVREDGPQKDVDKKDSSILDAPNIETLSCSAMMTWSANFSSDPTKYDDNGDGILDWHLRNDSPFPASELVGGAWASQTTHALDTNPPTNFYGRIQVDMRMRHTASPNVGSEAWDGAMFWINVDYTAGEFGVVFVTVKRLSSSMQRVTVYTKISDSTAKQLLAPMDVGSEFVHIQLDIDAENHIVNAWADGLYIGQAEFFRYSAPWNNDQWATLIAARPTAEFDDIQIKYCPR